MIGDILLIREEHKNAAESIARKVIDEIHKKPKNYKFIVGISGESGTGKSEISHSIALRLKKEHIRVKILHTDNYYSVPPLLQSEWRKAKGIESVGMAEYDWSLINRNISDFKEDRESMLPIIDIIPEQVDKLITDFKKIDLLILDGLYAIKSDGVDLRIFIELTTAEAEAIEKDPNKKERSEFAKSVLEKEHQNVLALKPLSDLIVNKGYQVLDSKTETPI
jgi:uridine kinase